MKVKNCAKFKNVSSVFLKILINAKFVMKDLILLKVCFVKVIELMNIIINKKLLELVII